MHDLNFKNNTSFCTTIYYLQTGLVGIIKCMLSLKIHVYIYTVGINTLDEKRTITAVSSSNILKQNAQTSAMVLLLS